MHMLGLTRRDLIEMLDEMENELGVECDCNPEPDITITLDGTWRVVPSHRDGCVLSEVIVAESNGQVVRMVTAA